MVVPESCGPIEAPRLKRALGLPLLVFYGLGTILGAGIYVLVGEVAASAGRQVPLAFLVAAVVAGFTAFSFAELSSRIPVSAGEAAFVRTGLRSRLLARCAGWGVVLTGTLSTATIAHGFFEYLTAFTGVAGVPPRPVVVAATLVVLGGLAAWGVTQSVVAAAVVTVIEILGLVFVVAVGGHCLADLPGRWREFVPGAGAFDARGVLLGAHVAFFAFIGFEDIVNMAEETRDPERNLPRAIVISLVASTLLYMVVALVAVASLPVSVLASSDAPLAEVVAPQGRWAVRVISAVSMVAVLNGALIQIIMASRVLYGMARQGDAPSLLGRVAARTRTPLVATASVTGFILVLALAFRLEALARFTSTVTLVVFSLVNAALIALKRRGEPPPRGSSMIPVWVPIAGLVLSLGLLLLNGVFLVAGAS